MRMTSININPNHMFSGQLSFLSNMYPCRICINVNGRTYVFQNAEAAFQAGKCLNPKDIELIAHTDDGKAAKKLGRKIEMRRDWDSYRITWMRRVVYTKFKQNPDLMGKLLDTYPIKLVETNTWHDTFWGVCDGKGQNWLGKILMEIRETKRESFESNGTIDLMTF